MVRTFRQVVPHISIFAGAAATSILLSCGAEPDFESNRAALVDTILATVERREAFSEFKDRHWGGTALQRMQEQADGVLEAESDLDLYYALLRLSNARRDTHLSVALIQGGIQLPDSTGLDIVGMEDRPVPEAAVRLLPDYGTGDPHYFVADHATGTDEDLPPLGSRVLKVNAIPISDWEARAFPYVRASTTANLRWRTAQRMSEATAVFPPDLRSEKLTLEVAEPDGATSVHSLLYHPQSELQWKGRPEPKYDGFALVKRTETYEAYVPEDGRRWVLLKWYGFRETMVADVDTLIDWAQREGRLDHALVIDATRSRGGSLGPYAVQRFSPRPFKTIFGNLRISDVVPPFIERKQEEFAARQVHDGTVPETIDDGGWLIEWLETDVGPAIARNDAYSNNVPFKSAHGSRLSDGVLSPAPVHFSGPLVAFSGPRRGSHLDQLLAIVVDNDLGHFIGMPGGGYSNTWEWEETLTMPGSERPLVQFMWSIGHSIRPNGEVLEGNPADPDEWLPLTSQNFEAYYSLLLDAARSHLETLGY